MNVPTFRELGKEMGICKSRVEQIYKRALNKIRENILRDPELKEAAAKLLMIDEERLVEK